jgi:hypothetical protein
MKRSIVIAVVACFAVTISAIAATQSLSDGIAGVPWSGSRDQFRRAIPSLTCAPIVCRGSWNFHGVDGELELTWGGFSPVITSSIFKFTRTSLSEMKRLLTRDLGSPNRQYTEEGERVTEWKRSGALVDLYHGSKHESPQIYLEPKRKK